MTSFVPVAALLLLIASLCLACNQPQKSAGGASQAEPLMTGSSATLASLPAGQQTFLQNCSACHFREGRLGPPLVEAAGYFVRAGVGAGDMGKLLFEPVRVKRPGSIMPAFSSEDISDEELMELGAWLAAQTPAPETAPALGDAAKGKELYANNCAQCHGAQGEGIKDITKVPMSAVVADLRTHEMPSAAWLGFVNLYARTGGGSAMVPFTETQLSDSDLADIAAFSWELPPPGPPPGEAPGHSASNEREGSGGA